VPDIHAAKAEFEAIGKRVLGEPRIGAHGYAGCFDGDYGGGCRSRALVRLDTPSSP
jgi:hypothetical protein